jgi:hypothetical protein
MYKVELSSTVALLCGSGLEDDPGLAPGRAAPMPQAPARPRWCPARPGSVLRTPGDQPGCEHTTAPSRHGVHTCACRHTSPGRCHSRRRPSAYGRGRALKSAEDDARRPSEQPGRASSHGLLAIAVGRCQRQVFAAFLAGGFDRAARGRILHQRWRAPAQISRHAIRSAMGAGPLMDVAPADVHERLPEAVPGTTSRPRVVPPSHVTMRRIQGRRGLQLAHQGEVTPGGAAQPRGFAGASARVAPNGNLTRRRASPQADQRRCATTRWSEETSPGACARTVRSLGVTVRRPVVSMAASPRTRHH